MYAFIYKARLRLEGDARDATKELGHVVQSWQALQ